MNEVLVGYIVWDSINKVPYRPTLGHGWRAHKTPARIYKTKTMAISYGQGVGQGCIALPVYVKVKDATNENSGILEPL